MIHEHEKSLEEAKVEQYFNASATEALTDVKSAEKVLPKEVVSNPEFQRQVAERRRLSDRLDAVFAALPRPDVDVQKALEQGKLSERQLIDLYESLSKILDEDSEYHRMLLYLPFELLPDADWNTQGIELEDAGIDLRGKYLHAWDRLLGVHDVRANFVDGDVMDMETRDGDLDRVVKAAHLIPGLMEKGWLEAGDVFELLQDEDDFLVESVKDVLPVLLDKGLIEQIDLDRMGIDVRVPVRAEKPRLDEVSAASVEQWLLERFAQIDGVEHEGIIQKRVAWLRKDGKRIAVEEAGEMIAEALLDGSLSGNEILESDNVSVQQAFVEGVLRVVHEPKVFEKYQDKLTDLWVKGPAELRDVLAKTFFHAVGHGVMSQIQLETLGLKQPKLAGPFSENARRMKKEMGEVTRIAEELEGHEVLSKLVYPTVLTFGSRLKGYGAEDSDLDVGVFVRPGVKEGDVEKMREALKEVFGHESIGGESVEFWLEENGDELLVQNPDKFDRHRGISIWTYVLFGAVWNGEPGAVQELRQKVLAPYMYENDREFQGIDERALCIEELERDTLQYRLMHKGYERFHPRFGGVGSDQADRMDGDSMFWDSGYRQAATKLYADRVFLPKLER